MTCLWAPGVTSLLSISNYCITKPHFRIILKTTAEKKSVKALLLFNAIKITAYVSGYYLIKTLSLEIASKITATSWSCDPTASFNWEYDISGTIKFKMVKDQRPF